LTAPSHKYRRLIAAAAAGGATRCDTDRTQLQGRQEIGLKFSLALPYSQYFYYRISELKERL